MRNFFKATGVDFDSMLINEPISINGWEVKTLTENGKEEWRRVTRIVKKPQAIRMEVVTSDHTLVCSPEHRILVKQSESTPYFEEVGILFKNESSFKVMTTEGWQSFEIFKGEDMIDIADVEIEGLHSYLSNGIVSHNTLYGDPTTTPYGQAMLYYSSVRIKLGAGSQIKQMVNGKEVVVGINVSAKTIKNKVSSPFRSVDFEIHFGEGIVEHEQIFDYLREWCENNKNEPAVLGNKKIVISGGGAWKSFVVSDVETGEIIKEVKFYKAEFGEKVLYNQEHREYIKALMDAAYIMKKKGHATFSGADLSNPDEAKEIKRLKTGKEEEEFVPLDSI
jgi:hypothetical protein